MTKIDNFKNFLEKSKTGAYQGLPGGLPVFDEYTAGIQKGWIYTVIGGSGTGKSYFVLYRYILSPWAAGIRNINWYFYSLEMPENMILARIIGFFYTKKYKEHITLNKILGFSKKDYLTDTEYKRVLTVVDEDLKPLMERLNIITDRSKSNPTGIYKYMLDIFKQNGTIEYETYSHGGGTHKRFSNYIPNDPSEHHQILIDHCGLMKKEKGYSLKANIDKWVDDYAVVLSNNFNATVINVSQLNRGIYDNKRLTSDSDLIPSVSDIKETSSYEQSSDQIIALFNPSAIKQTKITKHANYNIDEFNGFYRSIHLIKSRYTFYPYDKALLFNPFACSFYELPKPSQDLSLHKSISQKLKSFI